MSAATVLLLPGWQDSGPGHWQTRWQQRWGDQRVQQADWMRPLRGDWICQLEQAVQAAPPGPLLLAAHSLGCHLVAGWAGVSRLHTRIAGALLVAPADLGRDALAPVLHSWRGHPLAPLPFPSHLVSSDDDPYASPIAARAMAAAWGSRHSTLQQRGHINGDSGLGDWPQGRDWLLSLLSTSDPRSP